MWMLIWLALTGFFSVALNDEAYFIAQQKAGVTAENARYSDSDRLALNRETAMYLAGRGELSDAFSDRAAQHMRDVKRLFDQVRRVMYGSLAMGLFCLIISGKGGRKSLPRLYWAEMALMALGMIILGFLKLPDFEDVFLRFHKAVFSNDLWLLDPAEDALIRVMPQAFFANMAQYTLIDIGLRWLIGGALVTVTHWLTGRKIQA